MPGSYWNEEIETLSSDGIERLESKRLQAQMAYLYANSDYFRARFDQAGIKPQATKKRSDLAAIPFMEKHEIAESQQQGQLLGINQCAAQSDLSPNK